MTTDEFISIIEKHEDEHERLQHEAIKAGDEMEARYQYGIVSGMEEIEAIIWHQINDKEIKASINDGTIVEYLENYNDLTISDLFKFIADSMKAKDTDQ